MRVDSSRLSSLMSINLWTSGIERSIYMKHSEIIIALLGTTTHIHFPP